MGGDGVVEPSAPSSTGRPKSAFKPKSAKAKDGHGSKRAGIVAGGEEAAGADGHMSFRAGNDIGHGRAPSALPRSNVVRRRCHAAAGACPLRFVPRPQRRRGS
jgi:hypothetical protein